jgi:hypothetical protein
MMHCTMDDLLALRANEGSMWARQHVDGCGACQGDLDALYQRVATLKALPTLSPARDLWPVIRERALADRARRRRRWTGWGVAAAAAIASVVVLRPFTPSRQPVTAALERAKQQSAALEAELRRYDFDSRVVSGRAAALAAELEDSIASVDGRLTRLDVAADQPSPEIVRLWQDRVDLMRQLVDVHVTRAAYVGL